MLPVVALVGRPNVGKSTLFNCLTKTRDALVSDFPGLTRDRKYGKANVADYEFIVIDTGGIDGSEEGVEFKMAEQSLLAIEEADIVLFLVDAVAGLMDADKQLANYLRMREKPVYIVVNKIDGLDPVIATADFYAMGLGDIFPIAASHGRGVTSMMQTLFDECYKQFIDDEQDIDSAEEEETGRSIKVAIVGRPNVGKSTLTNRILGEDRVVIYDLPGTTRDSIYIPLQREERDYTLIDTAGVRRRGKVTDTIEKFSVIKTLQAIEDANVVLLVVDARTGIVDQDLSLLGYILNSGRSLVIVVNKWDGLSQDVRDEVKETLDRRLGFIDFARIHFISALHGSGVGNLFGSINEAFDSATKKTSTARLTRIMQLAQDEHQPPLVRGRRVKLKYAHTGGHNPPIVVIHGNQVEDLPDSYKRYLMNYFRRALDIMGTPIRIQFKGGENPFAGRRNKLTPTQQRKRQRLMKHIKERSKK